MEIYGSLVLLARHCRNIENRRFARQVWRRGRDLNPRQSFWPCDGLANRCLRPLGHLSAFSPSHPGSAKTDPFPGACWNCDFDQTSRIFNTSSGLLAGRPLKLHLFAEWVKWRHEEDLIEVPDSSSLVWRRGEGSNPRKARGLQRLSR